ncbi:MAG TPA: nucleotidyltransferase family protein [Acidimicrobiales bacterium]|nr:nucleotidyltransferase family protein [Acidimicrobiales bacterium]
MTTAALVLAAGEGSRFVGESHKLVAPFRGRPLWEWAVDAAVDAALDATYVVTGAVALALPASVREVHNDRWAEGQGTSLSAGIARVEADGHDVVVVGLADQPLVGADAWRAVAASTASPIVVASFDGERRPPVRLAAEVWPLLPTSGDEGARAVMRKRPDLVTAVPCSGQPVDIDTLEDLDRWS